MFGVIYVTEEYGYNLIKPVQVIDLQKTLMETVLISGKLQRAAAAEKRCE